MRKLSELLPIARKRLVKADEPDVHPETSEYTCHAADYCVINGEMSGNERRMLQARILKEISPESSLIGHMTMNDIFDDDLDMPLNDARYVIERDKWLDAFQAKLEAEERDA